MAIISNDVAIEILECFGIDSKDVISAQINLQANELATVTITKRLLYPAMDKLRRVQKTYCLVEKKLLFKKNKE